MSPAVLHLDSRRELTRRELELLVEIADGKNTTEIAELWVISSHTTRMHAKMVREKLNAATMAEAVAIGFRQGLLT